MMSSTRVSSGCGGGGGSAASAAPQYNTVLSINVGNRNSEITIAHVKNGLCRIQTSKPVETRLSAENEPGLQQLMSINKAQIEAKPELLDEISEALLFGPLSQPFDNNNITGWKKQLGNRHSEVEEAHHGGGGGGGGGVESRPSPCRVDPIIIHALFLRYLIKIELPKLKKKLPLFEMTSGYLVQTFADAMDYQVAMDYEWAARVATHGTDFTDFKICKESVANIYGLLHNESFKAILNAKVKEGTCFNVTICEAGDATAQKINAQITKKGSSYEVSITEKRGIIGNAGGGYVDNAIVEKIIQDNPQYESQRNLLRKLVHDFKTSEALFGSEGELKPNLKQQFSEGNGHLSIPCGLDSQKIDSHFFREIVTNQASDRLKLFADSETVDNLCFTGGAFRPWIARDCLTNLLRNRKIVTKNTQYFPDSENVFTSIGGALAFLHLILPHDTRQEFLFNGLTMELIRMKNVFVMPANMSARIVDDTGRRYVDSGVILGKNSMINTTGFYPVSKKEFILNNDTSDEMPFVILLDGVYEYEAEPTYYVNKINIPIPPFAMHTATTASLKLTVKLLEEDQLEFSVRTICEHETCHKMAVCIGLFNKHMCETHRPPRGKYPHITEQPFKYRLNMFAGKNGRNGLYDLIDVSRKSCLNLVAEEIFEHAEINLFFDQIHTDVQSSRVITKDFQLQIIDKCSAYEDYLEIDNPDSETSKAFEAIFKTPTKMPSVSFSSSSSSSSSSSPMEEVKQAEEDEEEEEDETEEEEAAAEQSSLKDKKEEAARLKKRKLEKLQKQLEI